MAARGYAMSTKRRTVRFCAVLLTIASTAIAAQAPAGGVSGFRNLNAPGATETDPYAISDVGVIAGDYVDSSGAQHGMILKGKTLTSVDRSNCVTTPGLGVTFTGINHKGKVVGWCTDSNTGAIDGFSYFAGKFITISFPGAVSTEPHGINDNGQIVGLYLDSANVQHGFLLNGKKYTTLDVPSHTNTVAWGINNSGLITLFALNSDNLNDAFLLNDKVYTNINVPEAQQSFVAAINNYGDRIYSIIDSSGNTHGAFFLNVNSGTYTIFDDPKGVNATAAFGLNDKLKIVGQYLPGGGTSNSANQGYTALGCCRGFPPETPQR